MDVIKHIDALYAHVLRLESKVAKLEKRRDPMPKAPANDAAPSKADFTVRKIVKIVAEEYGVHPSVILGSEKNRRAAVPRQEVMRRALAVGWSSTQVGRALGRDHSTVLTGAKRAAERLAAE